MKKLLKLLPILLIAVVGSVMFAACSDDDKDEPVTSTELPSQARTFIAQYFPSAKIVTAVKDKNDYEVTLSDGTRIDFDKKGEWTDVEATIGKTIPSGFYPEAIDDYVTATFPGNGINEITREARGYDVELVTGIDLSFDKAGTFLGLDY